MGFAQTVTWSLEDACSRFCPEHLIFKLSCIQLDQKHCLFLLPSANKFIFRPLFTQLLLSTFLSKHFGSILAERSFPTPLTPPIALEVHVALAERVYVCAAHHGQHRAYGHQSFDCSLNTVLTGIRCINGSGY